jgi:cellulose 1,4-beta-cellobiosidase
MLAIGQTVLGQHIGTAREEKHLKMPVLHCDKASGCAWEDTTSVLDSNWRWTHKVGCTNSSACNCYLGNVWQNSTCSGVEDCTQNCALDGEDEKGYKQKYGVETDGQGMMNLTFVSKYHVEGANGTNVGQRMYLLEDEKNYKMFKLLNREFTFTVDGSKLPCGLNGAVYFVEMDQDGGMAKYPTNKAGAQYGTGYCDAQCPHDMKWIEGEANLINWNGSKSDPNVGHGKYGTCCAEIDVWEANKVSTQMTMHACSKEGAYKCEGVECGDNNGKTPGDPGDRFKGICDKNGCDFNPYREGAHDFFGPGASFTLDSTKPMQVVTQFITDDGTDDGDLLEMRRFYVQDGKKVENPTPPYPGAKTAISDVMCQAQMANFSDRYDVFSKAGGMKGAGEAIRRGVVAVLSLWDDHDVGMIWLDATDPFPVPKDKPWGAPRGRCNQTEGNYSAVETLHGDSYVLYSDIRYGEIGSTLAPAPPPPAPTCPGGSLPACIAQCDPSDPAKYKACEQTCIAQCQHLALRAGAAKGNAPKQTVFPGEFYGNPMKA